MSRPSTCPSSESTAPAFPKPAGVTVVPDAGDDASPARSTFSFDPDPSDRAVERCVDFALPERALSRQRARYFEEQFAYRDDAVSSARDRVTKDAPVVAELHTNVVLPQQDVAVLGDLSQQLSVRYQRPESAIVVLLTHAPALLLGGSLEPCYVLTISALPVHLQPTTNKRNAALLQALLADSLGVPADRGIVRFAPIADGNLATSGTTILGEIERLERRHAADSTGPLRRTLTRAKGSRLGSFAKPRSTLQLARKSSRATPQPPATPPPSPGPGRYDSAVDTKPGPPQSPTTQHASPAAECERLCTNLAPTPSHNATPAPSTPKVDATLHVRPVRKHKSVFALFRR